MRASKNNVINTGITNYGEMLCCW